MTPYRIGSGAGYAGDRIDPAADLAARGALDALVFECLAERTIALAQLRRLHDPDAGFDPLLADRLRGVLPACLRQGTVVLTNMGAANPQAAGRVALQVAAELGLPRLRVAVVEGDDVMPWLRQHDVPLIDDPRRASDLRETLVSANAYLGADALLPALAGGADLVITGRVADPALFLAPLVHAFGWRADDWDRLGQGIVVGHLLECAAQVSGGYLADPGVLDVPDLAAVGFPLAEVQPDGSAVVTKLPGTGGRVDRLSVTAQLLYEIEDPAAYLQPDVVADFRVVRLHDEGGDRVQVQGGRGRERPARLKVTLGHRDGWIGEGQMSYAGPGAVARGRLALDIVRQRLGRLGLGGAEQRLELIGVDALHGEPRGRDREPYEVRLRVAVRCATRAQAERVVHEVEALYLNGPAAGGGATGSVREVIAAASALVPREAAVPRTTWMEHRA
ncbi:MAG: DUF1446 domain-containing protein [Rubrivivax sp.]|nr:DUF1446 domain-containing protein [Rubrivivax sp.]